MLHQVVISAVKNSTAGQRKWSLVCACVHVMDVIALGKVTKGDLFKGVTCRPRLEWKEKGSHRGFQRDIILGARLAVASPEGVEESVEEEEVLPSWAGISGGLVKL